MARSAHEIEGSLIFGGVVLQVYGGLRRSGYLQQVRARRPGRGDWNLPGRTWLGSSARLAAGETMIPTLPSSILDLDAGDHLLLSVDLQNNARPVSPFRDQDRMPAGSDRNTLLHRLGTLFRYWKNHRARLLCCWLFVDHSKPGLESQACRLACPCTEVLGFFSQSPKGSPLVLLVVC